VLEARTRLAAGEARLGAQPGCYGTSAQEYSVQATAQAVGGALAAGAPGADLLCGWHMVPL